MMPKQWGFNRSWAGSEFVPGSGPSAWVGTFRLPRDPHSIGPTGEYEVVHLNRLGCPGDIDLGQTEEFVQALGRGYPRATPGRLVSLSSDPVSGLLMVEATASDAGGELVVWTPTTEATHHVALVGLSDLRTLDVSGGRVLFATVDAPGAYSLRVEPKR